ncbi:MAG TPA: siderophore-interacting protein [Pseudonocardiaceae bacterium]|jgi:NADPH-dependent ferric siderophore reductase|nr:siderophore-interacting protein [Pseudonocardiaceae bacterium]
MTAMSPTGQGRKRAPRHPPELWRIPVLRTEPVTPRMVRITVGGPALASFPGGGGDQHVVLYFYDEGVTLPEPLTLTSARVHFATARPQMRSYTVRRHDPLTHELDIDFVLHGGEGGTGHDGGPGSSWAARARPGDDLIVVGPSPAYQPDPQVARHLFVGDETALPAIAGLLAELPPTASARVVAEVTDPTEQQPLPSPAGVEVTWSHRGEQPAGDADRLLAAVRELDLGGPADLAVWGAGERTAMLALRSWLLAEGGLVRGQVRTTAYWRKGHTGTTG